METGGKSQMRKWKMAVYSFNQVDGIIDYSELTEEEIRKSRTCHGYSVPLRESMSLNSPLLEDVRVALEHLRRTLHLRRGLEVIGGEKVTIFCQSPILGIDIVKELNGNIKVGSKVGSEFNQVQYNAIFEFANVLARTGWL